MQFINIYQFLSDLGFSEQEKKRGRNCDRTFYLRINEIEIFAVTGNQKNLFVLSVFEIKEEYRKQEFVLYVEREKYNIVKEAVKDKDMIEILEEYKLLNESNRKMIERL